MSRRVVVAVVSDLHCGSTVGLHPPEETPLDDGGAYTPSEAQRWLWGHWLAYWKRVRAIARGADLHILVNGDAVDGDHHGTAQIVSRHPGTQVEILKACWSPVLATGRPKSMTVVRGTEVHVGPLGAAEEAFARWLVAQGITVPAEHATKNRSHWHFRGEYGGVTIDATHHGRMGQRPWTKLSAVGTLAAQIVMEYAQRGQRPPDLAIRSHYHQITDTYRAFPTRVIQTPAWQLGTAYVHRIAPESLADIGGLLVTIDRGAVEVEPYLATPNPTPTWKAP